MTRRDFLNTATALAVLPGFRPPEFRKAASQRPSEFSPKFRPDPRLNEIFLDLSAPLHSRRMRDSSCVAVRGREVDLSGGYSLDIGDVDVARQLAASTSDFRTFMSVAMAVEPSVTPYVIRAKIGKPEGCPTGASEAFHLLTSQSVCEITGGDANGIRRALIYLEDEMLARGGPILPLGPVSRWAIVEDRITRSPVATYRWLTGWELEQEVDYYPDEYLNKLAHCGMNGVWVAGLLRRMVASKIIPELGPKSNRLEKLKRLTKKAARYGIKVYLFCIEPRALPPDHPALAAHPEIGGAHTANQVCLCVSSLLVQKYIREVMRELFLSVPELAGVINIFNGERLTTCWGSKKLVQSCPRCRRRSEGEVLAEDLNCFMDGIREASKTGKLVAWGYSGHAATGLVSFLPYLHRDIVWMGNFDHGAEKYVYGRRVKVEEYSLSSILPSETFVSVTKEMHKVEQNVYAKLQIGNTYELSSVPYISVPHVIFDKLVTMRELQVKGAMMSWIIGGYPSLMLKVAGEASFAPLRSREKVLTRIAATYWGPGQANRIVEAWAEFSRAFQLYLCAYQVFYFGPITRCPSYQLHLERETQIAQPYNWGITRERVRQPYEDKVSRWLGQGLTVEEMVVTFRQMGEVWAKGLGRLAESLRSHPRAPELQRQHAVAAATRLQFVSMANVLEFYALRDQLLSADSAVRQQMVRRMRTLTEDDIGLAEEMKRYVSLDCTIGWQSEIYDYSYSEQLLNEKIRHDRETLKTLMCWEKTGVDSGTLAAVLPTPASRQPAPATWREWLRWGD